MNKTEHYINKNGHAHHTENESSLFSLLFSCPKMQHHKTEFLSVSNTPEVSQYKANVSTLPRSPGDIDGRHEHSESHWPATFLVHRGVDEDNEVPGSPRTRQGTNEEPCPRMHESNSKFNFCRVKTLEGHEDTSTRTESANMVTRRSPWGKHDGETKRATGRRERDTSPSGWQTCNQRRCGPPLLFPAGGRGTNDLQHGESVLARAYYAPNWVAEHLGASSRRPRHPEPSTTKNSSSSRAEK